MKWRRGTMPFRGGSSAVIFEAILNRAPAPAIRLDSDLPTGLERIPVDRALEKDRSTPVSQHASEMRSELLRLVARARVVFQQRRLWRVQEQRRRRNGTR